MKQRILAAFYAATLVLCPGFLFAAAVETVSLTAGGGGTHQGAGAIAAALAAVDTGGEVRILEAGNYNSVTLIGNKSYTIKGMVNGVVILGSAAPGAMVTDAAAGPLFATLENLRIENNTVGRAFELQQHATNSITINFVDCVVIQSSPISTGSASGEAFRAQPFTGAANPASGGQITITATNTRFEQVGERSTVGGGTAGSQYQGFLVNGGDGTNNAFNGLNLTLTSCTIQTATGHALDIRGGDNMNILVERTTLRATLISGRRSGFVMRQGGASYNNGNFTFRDSYIYGPGEAFMIFISSTTLAEVSTGNQFIVERTTIDNRRFGNRTDPWLATQVNANLNQAIRLQLNGATAATANKNTFTMTNSIVLLHGGNPGSGTGISPAPTNDPTLAHNGTTAVQIEIGFTTSTQLHNIYICEGVVLQNNKSNGTVFNNPPDPDSAHAVANSAMVNFREALSTSSLTFNGDGNIMVTTATANAALINPIATFIPVAGGNLSSTLAAAGLNSTTYEIQAGSPLIDQGVTSASIQTAIGGVDKRQFVRDVGAPDVGAFEFGAGLPPNNIQNWIVFE